MNVQIAFQSVKKRAFGKIPKAPRWGTRLNYIITRRDCEGMNNHIENIFQDAKDIISILYPEISFYNFKEVETISNEDLLIIEDFAEDIIKEINRMKRGE